MIRQLEVEAHSVASQKKLKDYYFPDIAWKMIVLRNLLEMQTSDQVSLVDTIESFVPQLGGTPEEHAILKEEILELLDRPKA